MAEIRRVAILFGLKGFSTYFMIGTPLLYPASSGIVIMSSRDESYTGCLRSKSVAIRSLDTLVNLYTRWSPKSDQTSTFIEKSSPDILAIFSHWFGSCW